MTNQRGLFVQLNAAETGATPQEARLALGGLGGRTTGGVVRTGVLVDSMDPVVIGTGTNPLTYQIRPCVIVTKVSDGNGPTYVANRTTASVSTTAAPGSNSRIDAVYALQRHVAGDGGSGDNNDVIFGVVQGTVAPSPGAPSIPVGAVRLANVTVTANATSTGGLTISEPPGLWTGANGGIVPTSKGSRVGRAFDGVRDANVPLGMIIAGQSDTVRAAAFMQVGRGTGTTGPFGDLTVNLPQAFPTAILDAVVADAYPITGGGSVQVKFRKDASSSTQLTVRAYTGDGEPLASVANVAFTYMVWGY